MSTSISIVGIACCYPDARNARELWENVMAQRRAFRLMPEVRLRLADYVSNNRETPDATYSTNAALIEGYEFDRTAFRVAGSTFRSADMAHWLALDIAAQVLDDAGFPRATGLPLENTGVFLGNTLTGEFSRANGLRLRWPYVRRTLDAALMNAAWPSDRRNDFLKTLEQDFKKPFPPIGEESLAGGLSNTIAGRICNHFDFRGGGYTVDGACASSLIAVANACSALAAGDLDVALAGGVDLSLDPFELIGFAKAGALATDEMRVYDEGANGFWPGEGCGFALLMRTEDALAQRLRTYAQIKGWAISSDGHGGITRPEIDGQALVLKRAYARAGFAIGTVPYFEGHGTGTSVGDTVELKALASMIDIDHGPRPAAIGSVKANIGHTKAAAGIAGLIKSVLALHHQIIPPTTGCKKPHAEFRREPAVLRAVSRAEEWPGDRALRAGISAMGFGGINAHVVLEADKSTARLAEQRHVSLAYTAQDTELFLFGAQTIDQLSTNIDHLLSFAAKLSYAELADLASHLANTLEDGPVRAAVIAATPAELAQQLNALRAEIVDGDTKKTVIKRGPFFSNTATRPPRIGFLFPGQGSPSHLDGGALRNRFQLVDQLYSQTPLDPVSDPTATVIAQPAIVTASLAALRVLEKLNITAQVAIGHSLGELTAFHWGGAIDEDSLLRIARARGLAMSGPEIASGSMASLTVSADKVQSWLNGNGVVLAALNSPAQTVISGPSEAVEKLMALARAQGARATRLSVPVAFHSQLVAPAAPLLASHLANELFNELHRKVISTITGDELSTTSNLRELLHRQVTAPVRFLEAVTRTGSESIELWLEVGPGQVLTGLINDITQTPCVALDAGGDSLRGLLTATAAAFVMGQPIDRQVLFADRFTRPFDLAWQPKFFVNPCELAPIPEELVAAQTVPAVAAQNSAEVETVAVGPSPQTSTLETLRQLVAERAELPASAVDPENRFLSDLHLNSITVGQLVAETARRVGLPAPISPTEFADARISEVAAVLQEQLQHGPIEKSGENEAQPAGLDSWVRGFKVELREVELMPRPALNESGSWEIFALADDAFAQSLRRRLADTESGDGILVCVPAEPDETIVDLLLPAARLALVAKQKTRFVLVQQGKSAASFARTLYAEAPRINTCVITIPPHHSQAVDWVVNEALATNGFVEVHYDEVGRRYEPIVRPLSLAAEPGPVPLSAADLLIVTGGGKGITAECALALAKDSAARLVLIGRTQPDADAELSANLKRFAAAGIDFNYIATDITDADRVRELVKVIEAEGPVTGILHGAARNVPQLLNTLDAESFRRTLAVKVQGVRNLLDAINPEKLRLLATFGSVIARTGLPGEADYGLANEWLAQLTEDWSAAHRECRCLAVEWSVWSGQGMGERLGRARLMQQGITPISTELGIEMLRKLLAQPMSIPSAVVMSRLPDLPTFRIERPELPFLRFLEQPATHYPQIELIANADLSAESDPYLKDHQLQGEHLLPAVLGLEAMAQVAMALVGAGGPPVFENVRFSHPVVVPPAKTLKVRILALNRGPNNVEVALRSAETGFQVDHFQARCNFAKAESNGTEPLRSVETANSESVTLDPARDLYGDLLFHAGRFRRLGKYRRLKAKECVAEITAAGGGSWFSQYLPSTLVLGDPGRRDAAIHAIQSCIPHATLLPTGIERLTINRPEFTGPTLVHARERNAHDDVFVYDVVVTDLDGNVNERWQGLELRAVNRRSANKPWPPSLLASYLERRVSELIPTPEIHVVLVEGKDLDREQRGALAFDAVLGQGSVILKRPDGKPEVAGGRTISAAHQDQLTLTVSGPEQIGCDLEKVVYRPPSVWRALIGDEGIALAQLLRHRANESSDAAATRVWAARECLKKAGAMVNAPLSLIKTNEDGWAILSSGLSMIVTYRTRIKNHDHELVIAMLAAAGGEQIVRPQDHRELREVSHASL